MDEVQEVKDEVQEVEIPEPVKREDKRIKGLSEKVELTAKERDTYKAEAEKAAREAGFYKEFAGMVSKHPAATEFQDQIKEKVMAGYTPEDATYAILAKQGKLGQTAPVENPAGGSAINQPPKAHKSLNEMTRDEMLAALKEAEKGNQLWVN